MSIDLREELKDLFEVDEGGVSRWIIVRHFSDEHSDYWKPETHEAVGVRAYKYMDYIVRTYSVAALPATSIKSEGLHQNQPALIEESIYRFFLEYNVEVDENDEIFDLDYIGDTVPTVIVGDQPEDIPNGIVKPKERFKVRKVDKLRSDGGRIEFKVATADTSIYR